MSEIKIGDIFGNWTVLDILPFDGKKKYYIVQCRCEGATIRKMESYMLKSGKKMYCIKCQPSRHSVNIGDIYGNWKVIKLDEEYNGKETKFICECQCEFKTLQSLSVSNLKRIHSSKCLKCRGLETRHQIKPGDQFGQWTVIKENGYSGHCIGYLCECSCEAKNQQTVRSSSLIKGTSTKCLSCAQRGKVYTKPFKQWKRPVGGYKFLSNEYFNHCKYNAKTRNLPFEVSIEYVYSLYEQQRGYCDLTGQYLRFNRSDLSRPQDASLDRKDNSKGYLEGNLRWVHKDANLVRGELTDNELFFWCFRVIKTIFTKYPSLEYKIPEHHYKWKGYGDLWQSSWYEVEKRALMFNRELELSIKDGWELAEKQGFRCALSGVALKFGYKSNSNASLDRRDSMKGYTKENCQWIHKTLQPMKWHLDENYFKHICRNVYENEQLAGNIFSFI